MNAGLEVEDCACGAQCSSRTGQNSRLRARGAKVRKSCSTCFYKMIARIDSECLRICVFPACLWQVIAMTWFVHDFESVRAFSFVLLFLFPHVSQHLLRRHLWKLVSICSLSLSLSPFSLSLSLFLSRSLSLAVAWGYSSSHYLRRV